ncbi:MAG: PRC-barrel domain-containing protein [Candidatus Marsarchaeota archaeon]|nr:PRC-barrel domain-containing protein [Candidatus Marsarchaeota archaeon]
MKLSDLYEMDIYSDGGQYLGEVHDAIIDLERAEVSRILMEEWRNAEREEARRMLQQKSILFKNVKNIGDVVLVSISMAKPQDNTSNMEVSDLAGRMR